MKDSPRTSGAPESGLTSVGAEPSPLPQREDAADGTRSDLAPVLTPLAFEKRYSERRLLGRGGMGRVILCRDHVVGRDVALKLIEPRPGVSARMMERRFVREARVQGQLEHPAIVPVYDVGITPSDALYFTMKRVRGVSLSDVITGLRTGDVTLTRRYSQRRLLSLFSQVCMAVHFAHEKGVVHRDLKPSNLMFGDFGEVYVLDWGLAGLRGEPRFDVAERIDDGHDPASLATGVAGTPGFMAPEQIETPDAVDARADIYALGAILFEMLTLEPLHRGMAAAVETIGSTLRLDGASPSERAPDRLVPPEVDRICVAATRLHPDERIASAEAMSKQIDAYLDGDRDLALRKALAETHAERAATAFASAATDGDEARSRARAMREVSAALGLDPEHEGARQTLVRLITEAPRDVPAEAQAEIDANQRRTYRMAGRAALLFYGGYVLYLPLLLWMGVRDMRLFLFGWGTIAACALTTFLLLRHPPKRVDVPLLHLVVSTFTVGAVSVMFGPFVLVPMLALGNAVAYLSAVGHGRGLVPLSACLAVVVPHALRWAGVLPDTYVFADGTWTVLPAVFHIRPIPTQAFLLAAILGTLLPACMFVARLRKAYADAERKLQLQAWQLRQIVPEAPPRG